MTKALVLLAMLAAALILGGSPWILQARADGRMAMSSEPRDPPSYCGRRCYCGTAASKARLDTGGGPFASGWIVPDGASCRCSDVYRCDPAREGAPSPEPSPSP